MNTHLFVIKFFFFTLRFFGLRNWSWKRDKWRETDYFSAPEKFSAGLSSSLMTRKNA